jgi:glucan phosphoethanolaminetransferase (alkaline phosphatase superfamily)
VSKKAVYIIFAAILVSGSLLFFHLRHPQPLLIEISDADQTAPKIDRVVFITIDTLRADHLGCYGYPRNTSPFIDSLAKKGILFQRAFAAMSTTVPSHASIFTSLYPMQHNVIKNGHILADK